jgi:deazaflavin-dependent oxidoreductase (nitroreductase family)
MEQTIDQHVTQVKAAARKFPVPGTNLARILSDAEFRQAFHAQLKRYNPWTVILYRMGILPLCGVSRTVMLLTTRGRKSGKLRSTPIGYFRIGGAIHLFSAWGKSTSWYKNIMASPEEIWIQIGMHRMAVKAQVLEIPGEIRECLEQFVGESPGEANYLFGWEAGRDRMELADFSEVVERVLIVRFIKR